MENKKESVYIFSVPTDKIKKHILNRSIAKINCILYKINKIRNMKYEFDRQMDIASPPKTDAEQEKKAKKIDNFQREIEKRWGEVWADIGEIRTTMTILYELSEMRRKYIGVAEEEQMSWADIRRDIENKMKNSFCM